MCQGRRDFGICLKVREYNLYSDNLVRTTNLTLERNQSVN